MLTGQMTVTCKQVLQGMRELHKLDVAGKFDSAEAHAIRDTLDAPWSLLSAEERQLVQYLWADLYASYEKPHR